MKKIFFSAAALLLCMSSFAQMQMVEYFGYDERVNTPLLSITDEISTTNYVDATTGWMVQANSTAGISCYDIIDAPLSYANYEGSEMGHAVRFTPGDEQGQALFKPFATRTGLDSTLYVAFLIKFEDTGVDCTGSDYFWGMKIGYKPDDANFCGRIFAKVEHEIDGTPMTGEEISLGVVKNSGGTTTWVGQAGPYLTFNQTYLFVVKYHVGILNGTTADEEKDKYDDQMWLYVDPAMDAEPTEASAALYNSDVKSKDAVRYTSKGSLMEGLCCMYLRSAAKTAMPQYVISGIRAANTWEELFPAKQPQSVNNVETATKTVKEIRNGQMVIVRGAKSFSVLGAEL